MNRATKSVRIQRREVMGRYRVTYLYRLETIGFEHRNAHGVVVDYEGTPLASLRKKAKTIAMESGASYVGEAWK